MGDLSANFSRSEFRCKCGCGKYNITPALIKGLQELRDYLGMPIIIGSGTRCPEHNAAVGGTRNSYHVKGYAADIRVDGLTPKELMRAAEQIKVFRYGGIGLYDTFIHVDVRGHKARWRG